MASRAPGVTAYVLTGLGNIERADMKPARRLPAILQEPPASQNHRAFLRQSVDVRLFGHELNRTQPLAGTAAGTEAIAKTLVEVIHARPLVDSQHFEQRHGL